MGLARAAVWEGANMVLVKGAVMPAKGDMTGRPAQQGEANTEITNSLQAWALEEGAEVPGKAGMAVVSSVSR
ncbi:MAG TPA: hypothetical protein VKA48_11550 [Gammaproteobacteria bacterium]|nr:hypothetical protein [Gammaproteobacteria bacterium]